ncbi:MAG: hypothetical protein KIT84_21005 [Labilithrix sp.]|nr:hypothetical protein [Labilithrix sp.]MCW5813522.1 hypothetical protein [Labilithrix sp.]
MLRRFASAAVVLAALAASAPACSQGDGAGSIQGTLNIPECWNGSFDLEPDFFAAVPYRETSLTLRIQRGSDFQNFSDGISIQVNDIKKIRPDGRGFEGRYGETLRVDIPAEVTPAGTPVTPDPDPAIVAFSLYLQRSCKTQTVTLNAVDEVTLPSDGTCTVKEMMGADPAQGCAPDKMAPGGLGSGRSFIAFTSLANGRLEEEVAAERLNAGCFDIYLADPRDAQPGGEGPPPPCRGHLRGVFSFYFERGRPAQPFP